MKHMNGLFGVRSMEVSRGVNELQTVNLELIAHPDFDSRELYNFSFSEAMPGNVIVKCEHCGQWGARTCACSYCGAPVD